MPQLPEGLSYVSAAQVNRAKWDLCLAASPEALIYAASWYLDIACPGWAALVETRDGRYVSLFPLPQKKTFNLCQVYQPFFTQQLGLFTTGASRYTSVTDYLAVLPRAYGRVYYQFNTHNRLPAGGLPGFQTGTRTTYQVSLAPAYPDLFQKYRPNQKRNLKKLTDGRVEQATDPSALIQLFRENKGAEVSELKAADYARLALLFREGQRRGAAQVWEMREGEELLAAAFFLPGNRQHIYLFGASSPRGRETRAMAALLDAFIRRHAGTPTILDFEGSDNPQLAKFYANFGALPVPYLFLQRKKFPWNLIP